MDIDDFSDAFFQMEKDLKLFEWEIRLSKKASLQVWPIIRFDLFKAFTQAKKLYDWSSSGGKIEKDLTPPPGRRINSLILEGLGFKGVSRKLKSVFSSGEQNSVFALIKNAEYFVLPFNRRDENGNDKFTDFVSAGLGSNVAILGSSPWDSFRGLATYTALERFGRQVYWTKAHRQYFQNFSNEHLRKYTEIVNWCECTLDIELPRLKKWPEEKLVRFIAERLFWTNFFRRIKAKQLILAISSPMSLIAGAKDAGLKVTEIQHGLFNPYPMRFNWPGNPKVSYLPDEFWVWGEYWVHGFELAKGQIVKIMGANESMRAAMNTKFKKNANQIVFVAQPAGSMELFEAAMITARSFPEKSVIFRLHPGDFRLDIAEKFNEVLLPNLRLSATEIPILQLLAESEVAVGIFSTTLIESIALNTPVVVLQTSSWKRLKSLVDSGDAILADSVESVPEAISRARITSPSDRYYSDPATLGALLSDFRYY